MALYAAKIVAVEMYALPADRPPLLAAIRAEEKRALDALKQEWRRKDEADHEAVLRAKFGRAKRIVCERPNFPIRPRCRSRDRQGQTPKPRR